MRKRFKFLSVALAAVALTACNSDDILVNGGDIDGASKGAGRLEIKLDYPSTRAVADSVVTGTTAENQVNSVSIFVFAESGKLVRLYESDQYMAAYKFTVPEVGDKMKILVAVNAGVDVAPADTASNSTGAYEALRMKLSNAAKLDNTNSLTAPVAGAYVMGGWLKDVEVKPAADDKEIVTNVTIPVNRLISKVNAPDITKVAVDISYNDLTNLYESTDNLDTLTVETLKLTDYVLINGIDFSDAFYTWNAKGSWVEYENSRNWTDWSTAGKTWFKSTFNPVDSMYTAVYGGGDETTQFFLPIPAKHTDKVAFVYENKPQDHQSDLTLYNGRTVYSFILKGTINVNVYKKGNPVPVVTPFVRYWRANLFSKDDHHIKRNSIYTLYINTVRTIGYETPLEAEDEVVPKNGYSTVSVTLSINPWSVRINDTDL